MARSGNLLVAGSFLQPVYAQSAQNLLDKCVGYVQMFVAFVEHSPNH